MEEKTISFGEKLADFITEMEYGAIIHYQDIESVIDEEYGTPRYYRFIAKAKKILESRGKMIKPIGGKDYQILYPGDYSKAYVREVKIAQRRIRHGGKIIKGAPVNDMTAEERQAFNNVSDFHVRLEAQAHGSYVEVKRLVGRKQHPFTAAMEQH